MEGSRFGGNFGIWKKGQGRIDTGGERTCLFPVGPAVESGHVQLLSELPRLGHAHKVVIK